MALVTVSDTTLTDIADAIRAKNGTSNTYKPSEMPDAIEAISGGGITPTGTINIIANGTYDVTNYASASVSVPQSGSPYEDFTGGNIQAITSHGQEYILTDYMGDLTGIYSIKLSDNNKTRYEGYWTMAYNNASIGIQRYLNGDTLTLKLGGTAVNKMVYPGYADGNPVVVTMRTQSSTDVANHPLAIFGNYNNGSLESTKGAFTFYGLNVFTLEGVLVKKFVPWLDNGVACVKDLVSGTIYSNGGTGAFDYIDLEGVVHTA